VLGQQHRRCDRPQPKARSGALRRPIIVALLGATFVMFLAFNIFYAGFPVHAGFELKWSTGDLGLFYALMSGTMIVAQGPGLRFVSQRWGGERVFTLGMVGLVGAFVALSFSASWSVFLGAVLFALGNGLAWPTFQARLADAAGNEDQGAVQGAATSAGAAASILGLVVGGLLYPWLGVWLFVAAAALFALLAIGTPLWFRDRAQ
jgi:predicted MFS family arabinose efflux permease